MRREAVLSAAHRRAERHQAAEAVSVARTC